MKDFFQFTRSLILRAPSVAAEAEWCKSDQLPTPSSEASLLGLALCASIAWAGSRWMQSHSKTPYLVYYKLGLLSQLLKAVRIPRPLPIHVKHPFLRLKSRIHGWWKQLLLSCCWHIKQCSTSRYNSDHEYNPSANSVGGRKKRFRQIFMQKWRTGTHFSHGTKLGGTESKLCTYLETLC